MNIYEKLTLLQAGLKAPKSQYNSFGRYSYRSLEAILEGVKPLLVNHKLALILSDTVKQVGGDRYYLEATAMLINSENPEEKIMTTALAREALEKKGMDSSQITGAASSYARKYCLNGLFAIDDNRDDDSHNQQNTAAQTTKITKYNGNNGSSNDNNIKASVQHQPQIQGLSKEQLEWLGAYCQKKGYINAESKKEFMSFYGFNPKTTTSEEFIEIQKRIETDETADVQ
ncbi:MAG: ERF family protein [Desulfamplus sp.]